MNYAEAKKHAIGILFDDATAGVRAVYNDGTAEHEVIVVLKVGGKGTGRNDLAATANVPMLQIPNPQYQQIITINGKAWRIDQEPGGSGYINDGQAWQLPLTSEQKVGSWRR